MSVRGRFSIDVQFHDSTTAAGSKSLKSLSLQHATEYDFGKVAVVSGTCGTVAAFVDISPTTYKNAAGDVVSFSSVSRVAFSADSPSLVRLAGTGNFNVYSRSGQVAASDLLEPSSFSVSTTAGTSAYTIVMYGD